MGKKCLIHFSSDFERLVNLDSLIPHLCDRGLLTSGELEGWLQMKPGNSRSCQILHMLTILDKKGRAGFSGVVYSLKMDGNHTGHDELAEILLKECNGEWQLKILARHLPILHVAFSHSRHSERKRWIPSQQLM